MPEDNEEQQTKPNFIICPCCGKPTLTPPVKPKDELMDHWLACMVTATPFTHIYPMYNGRIYVTVRANSADSDGKVSMLASILDSIGARDDLMAVHQANIPQLKAMARICIHLPKREIASSGADARVFTPAECVVMALDKLYPLRSAILSGAQIDDFQLTMAEVTKLLTAPENVTSLPPDILSMTVETHLQLNNILMNTGFDKTFWAGIELA